MIRQPGHKAFRESRRSRRTTGKAVAAPVKTGAAAAYQCEQEGEERRSTVSLWTRIVGGKGRTPEELAERVGIPVDELNAVPIQYTPFTLPKRGGGTRTILAPDVPLKTLQRQLYHRMLKRLPVHPCVTGFRPGFSIASNAACHVGQAVVVRMDIRDFFGATTTFRVRDYFSAIGWNRPASKLLARLCTHEGSLPQGAPTSPVLSNAVNFRLDTRLSALARRHGAVYTRYADDLTFSFAEDDGTSYKVVVHEVGRILGDEGGYQIHKKRKLRVCRRYQRQQVTGLVVNEKIALPRRTRRWLRAVDHRLRTGGAATLTPAQRQGWAALEQMIEAQEALREP